MIKHITISPKDALEKLKEGNRKYITSEFNSSDISQSKRADALANGQVPYAIIITCSDSRVIPENIFMTGIGELFVIRIAGNVIDEHQLGSIEYAASHLGAPLIVVMGHTHCGAVDAFYVTRLFLVKFWYWHYTLFLDFSNTKSGITEDDCKNEAAVAEDGPRQVA